MVLDSTGPSTDPGVTLLVTDLLLDIEQLTSTLVRWIQPPNQFVIHQTVHTPNPSPSFREKDVVGVHV